MGRPGRVTGGWEVSASPFSSLAPLAEGWSAQLARRHPDKLMILIRMSVEYLATRAGSVLEQWDTSAGVPA